MLLSNYHLHFLYPTINYHFLLFFYRLTPHSSLPLPVITSLKGIHSLYTLQDCFPSMFLLFNYPNLVCNMTQHFYFDCLFCLTQTFVFIFVYLLHSTILPYFKYDFSTSKWCSDGPSPPPLSILHPATIILVPCY